MTYSFFTILDKYFHCCMCRCCNEKTAEENRTPTSSESSRIYNINDTYNPFTFDDLSNPSTPMSLSSSTSSFDSIDYKPHKRKNIPIGIIPSYYYTTD